MDADQGVAFLKALGAKKIKVKTNGWIEAACVLAPWLHKNHVDHTPSFGLSINPGERSYYACFACQSGSAEELLHTLELYTKGKHDQYNFALCHQLLDVEQQVLPLPEYGEKPQQQVFHEWPPYWLASFKKADWYEEARAYLATRQVDQVLMEKCDLRYDPKRQMVVFPYHDVFGRLAGARGRSIRPDVQGASKHYDYSWEGKNNCRLCWYNEGVLNLHGPAVIVEGQFDAIRTSQAYSKVVANLTAKPSLDKMKKLGDCPFIIQIPDRDDAGLMSMGMYAELCFKLGIGYKMLWLDEGVKDPAECAVEYLKEKIEGLL